MLTTFKAEGGSFNDEPPRSRESGYCSMFDPEFFPTPRSVAYKMRGKISDSAQHILEPSAGRGDLAEVLRGEESRYGRERRKIDCIERHPELVSVLHGKDFPVVGFDWLEFAGVSYYDAIVMNPP